MENKRLTSLLGEDDGRVPSSLLERLLESRNDDPVQQKSISTESDPKIPLLT